jgi:hypothetical protein
MNPEVSAPYESMNAKKKRNDGLGQYADMKVSFLLVPLYI